MVKQKKGILESLEAEVVNEAENFVKQKVKNKILRISEISILIILGFFLISFGLAEFIEYQYPMIPQGMNYIGLGVVFLVISYLLKI